VNVRAFHLVSRWRIEASAGDVYAALVDLESLPRWWPGIESVRGHPARPGCVRIVLRGLLPVRLRIDVRIAEARPGCEIRFDAHGDLVGTGRWTLHASGRATEVTLTWDVRLAHPLLARLPDFLRPALAASHHFVMWRGERGLNRALMARHPACESGGSSRRA
jgi:hypothetical protein